jgi:hypothetical protein
MSENDYLYKLGKNQLSAEELIKYIKDDFSLLPMMVEGISSANPRIKFGCAKILSKISEDHPEELYNDFEFFIDLLDIENNIIKWNAMDVLANLTKVDKKKKFDDIFTKYYDFINADTMVTVAHVVDNSGKIALAKPHLTKQITNELLKIEKIPIKPKVTQECKNILFGKAINAFDQYYDQIENPKEVVSFIKRQLKNTRLSTKVKAQKFMKNREIKF